MRAATCPSSSRRPDSACGRNLQLEAFQKGQQEGCDSCARHLFDQVENNRWKGKDVSRSGWRAFGDDHRSCDFIVATGYAQGSATSRERCSHQGSSLVECDPRRHYKAPILWVRIALRFCPLGGLSLTTTVRSPSNAACDHVRASSE
jgi:hypothetical protein